MNRRRAVLVALVGSPVMLARAQQPTKVARIGFLSPFARAATVSSEEAFRQGLRELGWIEGRNSAIEYRYAEGKRERLPDLAADLVRLKVDVIVTSVGSDTASALKTTRTIPIVSAAGAGTYVFGPGGSLARPGGNVTGSTQLNVDLIGKRLELLRQIVPKLSRVAVLWNPHSIGSTNTWKEMQLAARQLGVELHLLEVRSSEDFEIALNEAIKARASALILTPDPLIDAHMKPIAEFAAKKRLPSTSHLTQFVEAGGLIAYGVNRPEQFRRAASFVDKILKGAKPGELPIEQPSKFELVINLRTAKAIGIHIPESVLLQANKVIE
jgi:putative tryptophan/tyrosine transport system substrate-binding protein